MLKTEEEQYILTHAYVPEHVVALVTSLSAGEPFLIEDHFCCRKDDWIIFIGYPLRERFDADKLELILEKIKAKFKPAQISLIAPTLPNRLASNCRESDSDYYYTVDTQNPVIRSPVKRNLRKAARRLMLECATHMGDAHQELMREFVQQVDPPLRVANLLFKMPQYVGAGPHSFVLNAWCPNGVLAAFYVVDFAAAEFGNYIIGCYSKKNYVLGASDLLLMKLIRISDEYGKRYIHLGLGINDGIRRFKKKWGASPSRPYQMCELIIKKPLIMDAIRAVMAKSPLPR
jgi:hypothetical protein